MEECDNYCTINCLEKCLWISMIYSGEARRKWMVVPITDLRTLKIHPKRQLDNYTFDCNGKVLLLENDHKNDGN